MATESPDDKPQEINPSAPLVVSPEECPHTPPVIDVHHIKDVPVEPFLVPAKPIDDVEQPKPD